LNRVDEYETVEGLVRCTGAFVYLEWTLGGRTYAGWITEAARTLGSKLHR
jgi:hypothetical protein